MNYFFPSEISISRRAINCCRKVAFLLVVSVQARECIVYRCAKVRQESGGDSDFNCEVCRCKMLDDEGPGFGAVA